MRRAPEFILKAKETIIKLNETKRNEIRAIFKAHILA